jgi:hypothetical protein
MNTVNCEKIPTISGNHREITKMQMYRTNTGSMTKQTITLGITDASGTQQIFQDLFVHDSVQIAAAVRRTNLLMKLECTFKKFV